MRLSRLMVVLPLLSLVGASVGRKVQAASTLICSPHVTLIAHGYGSPDDVAISKGRVLFGDLANGTLAADRNGHVSVLISGLRTPEGIIVKGRHRVVVVEQGLNRLDTIDLASHRRRVLLTMANGTGLEGVDGVHPAPDGGIYIPDSPYGTLYLLDARRRLHLLAKGMDRPVDAIHFHGGVAVADENAHAVWMVRGGRIRRLATVDVPDDLVIFRGRLVTDSLGDGHIWEVWPSVRILAGGFNQPQGLAVLNQRALVVTSSNTNRIFAVSNLAGCL